MANAPITTPLPPPHVPVITARDPDLSGLFPAGFESLYEVHSYRNAASILATTCKGEFREIVDTLTSFRIPTEDIVAAGGNKSKIAIGMEQRLKPLGWLETRIVGHLLVTRITRAAVPSSAKKGPKTVEKTDLYRKGFPTWLRRPPGVV